MSDERNRIAARAYELWVQRGMPEGSPEVDWLEAESQLKGGLSVREPSSGAARAGEQTAQAPSGRSARRSGARNDTSPPDRPISKRPPSNRSNGPNQG
jgi:hypothetical protein